VKLNELKKNIQSSNLFESENSKFEKVQIRMSLNVKKVFKKIKLYWMNSDFYC
jgi:hypothetical protein